MAALLNCPVLVAGEVHATGTDVSKIATPGELASLESMGRVRFTKTKAGSSDAETGDAADLTANASPEAPSASPEAPNASPAKPNASTAKPSKPRAPRAKK